MSPRQECFIPMDDMIRLNPDEQSELDMLTAHFADLVSSLTGDEDFISVDEEKGVKLGEYNKKKLELLNRGRKRAFSEILEDSPDKILPDFMSRASAIVDEQYLSRETRSQLLDRTSLYELITEQLKLHLDYLRQHRKNEYTDAVTYLNNLLSDTNRIADAIEDVGIDPASRQSTQSARSTNPSVFMSTTDSISNYTFSPEHRSESNEVSVNTGRDFNTILSINYDALEGEGITISGKRLNDYDRMVHDSILTLFSEGKNRYITPSMVYHVTTGNYSARISRKQTDQITQSFRKLSRIHVIIDETNNRPGANLRQFHEESALIQSVYTKVRMNGAEVNCLEIIHTPTLLKYALLKHQITRSDISLFRIDGVERVSTDFLIVQKYLWRRISAMKNTRSKVSHTILFSTLYRTLDLDERNITGTAERNKKKAVRDDVKLILDTWIRMDWIKGYHFNIIKGKQYNSVEIDLTGDGGDRRIDSSR